MSPLELAQVDLVVDVLAEPVLERADAIWSLVDQVGDLLGDDLTHRNTEGDDRGDQHQEDHTGADASPHPTTVE